LGNDEDAKDAVQEALIRAFRGYGQFRGGDAKAWFLTTVRNCCMNVARERDRKVDYESEELENRLSSHETPEHFVFRSFDAEQLRRAIEALPATLRELILLREFEQMSYRELAEVAGIPIGTVMSRLSRARERLHELLCEEAL
jgi:RNA polymerase sigma-70 factor (ECF subfamily)